MLERHVVRELTAYCHHELTAAESSRVQLHLEACEPCRREYEGIRLIVELASKAELPVAAGARWEDVERALDQPPAVRLGFSSRVVQPARLRWVFALASLVLVGIAGGWYYWRLNRPFWEVARLEGKPKVGWSTIGAAGRIAEGDWLETDYRSRALINVGDIGEVEVD